MTTKVTIFNDEVNAHDIETIYVGQQYIIKPGNSIEFHMFKGTNIIVREVPENGDIERLENEGGPVSHNNDETFQNRMDKKQI